MRYLHIGGDDWNRCHAGWLNIDAIFENPLRGRYRFGTDDKGGHAMTLDFTRETVLPFRSHSVQLVYSEHMIEHLERDGTGMCILRHSHPGHLIGGES